MNCDILKKEFTRFVSNVKPDLLNWSSCVELQKENKF